MPSRGCSREVKDAPETWDHSGVTYGIWGPSQFQGTIAGLNVAGEPAEFMGIPRSNMLKVLGYDLFSIGQILTEDASYEVIDAERDGRYFYFVFRDHYLVGSILLGDTSLSAGVKKNIEKHQDCSPALQKRPGVQEILDFVENFQ
jgi:nitrite reductase (NADH) large subunit